MKKEYNIFALCFKQIRDIKMLFVLVIGLLLHLVFNQEDILSAVQFFEGIIPFIFTLLFFNTVNVDSDNKVDEFETMSQYNSFTLLLYRYISCFIISMFFSLIVLLEYRIIFNEITPLYNETVIINDVMYTNINFFHIMTASVFSIFIFSTFFVFFNIMLSNRYFALVVLFLFVTANFIFGSWSFNVLSLTYKGTNWLSNKLIWCAICFIMYALIYLKYIVLGKLVQTTEN